MKISKLFHWLYAILMFLPIMVFIPNAFYYGFNEHAVAQEKTEQVPVYYESNVVTQANDIIVGNVYYYSDNFDTTYRGNDLFLFSIDSQFYFSQFPQLQPISSDYINFYISGSSGQVFLWVNGFSTTYITNQPMYLLIYSVNSYDNLPIIVDYIHETDHLFIKEYQPLVTNMSITDSMSYAWKSTWQNELFSWSYDSFLTQPFLYITNLFNVPATNTLLYCLSYWLNISIIWLCFDVVMYVPLLVHRWLDKGIVE